MIRKIRKICALGTDPYENLAMEETLLNTVAPEECIVYLWQNRRTVVIGQNQNPWKECHVTELEQDGGVLVRRLSGGGAVYHDLGNLNFTFLMWEPDFDLDRQMDVLVKAFQKMGLDAEKTGRNDVTVKGRKVCGNAFYHANGHSYHHGSILVQADMDALSKYLNVPADKLQAKGVASVRSRVANLTDFCPEITIETLSKAIFEAFQQEYDVPCVELKASQLDKDRVRYFQEKYVSWEWNFGRKFSFERVLSRRFDWGGLEIQMKLEQGKVKETVVYTDAMDVGFAKSIPWALRGCIYSAQSLSDAVGRIKPENHLVREMQQDVQEFLKGADL